MSHSNELRKGLKWNFLHEFHEIIVLTKQNKAFLLFFGLLTLHKLFTSSEQ